VQYEENGTEVFTLGYVENVPFSLLCILILIMKRHCISTSFTQNVTADFCSLRASRHGMAFVSFGGRKGLAHLVIAFIAICCL
jgi:hypothetical protein